MFHILGGFFLQNVSFGRISVKIGGMVKLSSGLFIINMLEVYHTAAEGLVTKGYEIKKKVPLSA